MAATTANSQPLNTFLGSSQFTGGTPSTSGGGTLIGTQGTGGILGELYGQTPGVANPVSSAATATQGNYANLPELSGLTYGTDLISNTNASMPYNMNLPNYQAMLQGASGNALSELGGNIPGMPQFGSQMASASNTTGQELGGQVPADVQQQIQQAAAERGAATGQGGNSPNTQAAYLQALGLNSEQQQQTGMSNLGSLAGLQQGVDQAGQQNLSSLIASTPTGTEFNPASMFVTPEDQQSAAQAAQNAAAAPDPAASGIFSSIMSLL